MFTPLQCLAMKFSRMCCFCFTVPASGSLPYFLTTYFILLPSTTCFSMCCPRKSQIMCAWFPSVLSSFARLLPFCVALSWSLASWSCALYGESVTLCMEVLLIPFSSSVMVSSVADITLFGTIVFDVHFLKGIRNVYQFSHLQELSVNKKCGPE